MVRPVPTVNWSSCCATPLAGASLGVVVTGASAQPASVVAVPSASANFSNPTLRIFADNCARSVGPLSRDSYSVDRARDGLQGRGDDVAVPPDAPDRLAVHVGLHVR